MSNRKIILVEGEQDKQFLKQVQNQLQINGIEILELEIETMGGDTGLSNKLANEIKTQIEKDKLDILGIVIDMDAHNEQERLNKINSDLEKAGFNPPNINAQNKLFNISLAIDNSFGCQAVCYFMNCKGQGNLEDVLLNIRAKSSDFADALQCWRDCATKKGKTVKESDYKKQLLQFYARYDMCSKKEASQAAKNCTFEKAFEKGGFDLNSHILADLHQFLNLFK